MQQILEGRGFELTCRGSVDVKGKGSMITYFLKGKKPTEIKEELAKAEIEPPKSLPLTKDPEKLPSDAEKQRDPLKEDPSQQEDDLLPSPDIDLNSNMQNLTAQRRKSLCRQHNISSSFGTTVSCSTGITPSISNSSSVVTIGALPAILRGGNPTSNPTDNCSECGGGSKSLATPTAPPRTLVAELKDEIARDEKIGLKDSIENLEILLKNNISLSDLSNKQQQNLRGESASTTTTLRKRDTIVSFNVTETVTTTATPFSSSSGSSTSSSQTKKRRSVTTIAASCTTSTTMRLLSNESQSSTQTAPGTLESSVPGQSSTETCSQDWQPRTATLEPNRSPIKTSQSMSPIGQLTTEVFVLPNSRSMVLISSSNDGGSTLGLGTGGGSSSPRTGVLQDVST